MRAARVLDLPGQQVLVEPGLVHRVDRAETHGDGGELPEVGHQPRMRVGRQPATRMRQLLTETVQLLLGQPSFEERAGVDPRCRVALEEDLVAGLAVVLAAEEVVEADLIQAGRGGVGGDVPADAEAGAVGPGHHDGGVPPDVGADPALDVLVAGEPRLALGGNGVDEVGAAQPRHADLLLTGPLQQAQHDVPGTGPAAGAHHVVERLDPFPGLVRVDVGQLGGKPVADDRETLTSGSHGISSPSAVVGRRVAASPVGQGRLVAALCIRGCPDQFWYVSPGNASLPGGSRRSPEGCRSRPKVPDLLREDFRPSTRDGSRASVGTR